MAKSKRSKAPSAAAGETVASAPDVEADTSVDVPEPEPQAEIAAAELDASAAELDAAQAELESVSAEVLAELDAAEAAEEPETAEPEIKAEQPPDVEPGEVSDPVAYAQAKADGTLEEIAATGDTVASAPDGDGENSDEPPGAAGDGFAPPDAPTVEVEAVPVVPLRERDPRFASPRGAAAVDVEDDAPALTRPTLRDLQEAARVYPLLRIRVRLRKGVSSPCRVAGLVLTHDWKECDVRYVRDKGEACLRALADNPDIELQPAE